MIGTALMETDAGFGSMHASTRVISDEVKFGQFVASPSSRTLLANGKPVCLGGRAYDLLMLLLETPGRIVSKASIMRHVWPTTTVDESNLRFQMTSLRRALGEERGRIKTITGRGYLFVGEQTVARPSFGPVRAGSFFAGITGSTNDPMIVVIDADPDNREALRQLLRPFAARIRSYDSFESLLGCVDKGSQP